MCRDLGTNDINIINIIIYPYMCTIFMFNFAYRHFIKKTNTRAHTKHIYFPLCRRCRCFRHHHGIKHCNMHAQSIKHNLNKLQNEAINYYIKLRPIIHLCYSLFYYYVFSFPLYFFFVSLHNNAPSLPSPVFSLASMYSHNIIPHL